MLRECQFLPEYLEHFFRSFQISRPLLSVQAQAVLVASLRQMLPAAPSGRVRLSQEPSDYRLQAAIWST